MIKFFGDHQLHKIWIKKNWDFKRLHGWKIFLMLYININLKQHYFMINMLPEVWTNSRKYSTMYFYSSSISALDNSVAQLIILSQLIPYIWKFLWITLNPMAARIFFNCIVRIYKITKTCKTLNFWVVTISIYQYGILIGT